MEPFRTTAPQFYTLKRGVTVVELLIVLAIIGVLTVVMTTSHTTFNRTILLSYTAYDVALTIRSAETYGLGTRVTSSDMLSNTGYGIHITPNSASFTFFADENTPSNSNQCHQLRTGADGSEPDAIAGNCAYDGDSEKVQLYTLGNGMKITNVYGYRPGAATPRDEVGAGQSLDMVFARPNPKAFMSYMGAYVEGASACLEIASPQGGTSHVYVGSTGQVTVGSKECPASVL